MAEGESGIAGADMIEEGNYGFGFRVSGFGFRVQGFGLRV